MFNSVVFSMFRSALGFLWKEWCWSWNSSTLSTSWEELTHWKRLWCWEGLEAGVEGGDREWNTWMASRTRWSWVWVNSRRWWWTGRPGMLQFMGSQIVGQDWVTELKWTIKYHKNKDRYLHKFTELHKDTQNSPVRQSMVSFFLLKSIISLLTSLLL